MRVKVISAQHALEMAVVPWPASPQPLRGRLRPSCVPYWQSPFRCDHWTSGFKTARKMPTTGMNTAAETPHSSLDTHKLHTGCLAAGKAQLPSGGREPSERINPFLARAKIDIGCIYAKGLHEYIQARCICIHISMMCFTSPLCATYTEKELRGGFKYCLKPSRGVSRMCESSAFMLSTVKSLWLESYSRCYRMSWDKCFPADWCGYCIMTRKLSENFNHISYLSPPIWDFPFSLASHHMNHGTLLLKVTACKRTQGSPSPFCAAARVPEGFSLKAVGATR